MKKVKLVLFALLFAFMLTGCTGRADSSDGKINIVCTVFPIYDWVRELTAGCEDIEVSYLLVGGSDLHSYQPSMADIVKISSCDLFIYIGGESDEWVEDVVSEAVNKNMKEINLSACLKNKLLEEELKEGMQGVAEEGSMDEHIWLSLKNAGICCEDISQGIKSIAECDALIDENLTAYMGKLENLDNKYEKMLSEANNNTLIFADRFPFRYLLTDYNLDYYAAFSGCSADSEASFDTVIFLADKVKEINAKALFVTESDSCRVADVVNSVSGEKLPVLALDSMQSVVASDLEKGVDYCTIMENNYEVLKSGLK